jgi:hypothetical protein
MGECHQPNEEKRKDANPFVTKKPVYMSHDYPHFHSYAWEPETRLFAVMTFSTTGSADVPGSAFRS